METREGSQNKSRGEVYWYTNPVMEEASCVTVTFDLYLPPGSKQRQKWFR